MADALTSVQSIKHVIIVGGSLAGLLVGVILKTVPHIESITIFERSDQERLKDQGAGIRLSPEVVDMLHKYTSFPLEKYAETLKTYRILDDDGSDLVKNASNNWSTSWGRLFHGLRQAFEAQTVHGTQLAYRAGWNVESVTDDGSKLKVQYQGNDGQQELSSADLVVGADGASSTLRHLVDPESKRSYVGYVCLRGMVPTPQLSEKTQATFHQAGGFFFPQQGAQVVLYTVPSNEEDTGSGTCLNWVWYQLKTESELQDLMTDSQGVRHAYTLPMGSMREEIMQAVKKQAESGFAPQVTEVIQKTAQPFAQTVTDNIAGSNCFFGGKMLLVGDAAAGQRPHAASALTQASFHALLLKSMLVGDMPLSRWSEETHGFSSILVNSGHELGKTLVLDRLPMPVRMQKYWQQFMATQAELNAKWTELVGNDSKL